MTAVTTTVRTAMVLAAGLGSRMRPITEHTPKPLVAVGGRTMLDRTLDPLADAGILSAVVNVHHLADQIEAAVRTRTSPRILISDERAELLDSGGGVARAAAHLGEHFVLRNADSFWLDRAENNIKHLLRAYDPARMDTLLLLAPLAGSVGFDGKGDFFRDDDGRLTRRGSAAHAPFAYAGAGIMRTSEVISGSPPAVFSLNTVWNRQIAAGRLFGLVLDGLWLHVGTPGAIAEAEAAMAAYRILNP